MVPSRHGMVITVVLTILLPVSYRGISLLRFCSTSFFSELYRRPFGAINVQEWQTASAIVVLQKTLTKHGVGWERWGSNRQLQCLISRLGDKSKMFGKEVGTEILMTIVNSIENINVDITMNAKSLEEVICCKSFEGWYLPSGNLLMDHKHY